ncbi:MAG: MOSC domain-containing protein [Actinobacteria bacterium]|nr:MOSC domain-containing protein [Actinomycetota bacterium]
MRAGLAAQRDALVAASALPLGAPADLDVVAAATDSYARRFAGGERWPNPAASGLLRASLAAIHSASAEGRDTVAATATAGVVHRLSTSDGGVPKRPVEAVEVTPRGIVGDRQASRRHHGRPWQALCLWSLETISSLRRDGHPIQPGAAGENVTVAGIDWANVRPGCRIRMGPDVVAEVSLFALPCAANARWFRDGDFSRMHHERGPGLSRVYASVVGGGRVRVDDTVTLVAMPPPVEA